MLTIPSLIRGPEIVYILKMMKGETSHTAAMNSDRNNGVWFILFVISDVEFGSGFESWVYNRNFLQIGLSGRPFGR
jgi:hypothetical protein